MEKSGDMSLFAGRNAGGQRVCASNGSLGACHVAAHHKRAGLPGMGQRKPVICRNCLTEGLRRAMRAAEKQVNAAVIPRHRVI